jgi:hypothetical protein
MRTSGYLTLKQAAEYLGYAPSSLRKIVDRSRKLLASGRDPELRFAQGRAKAKLLFRLEWLDEFAKVEPRDITVTNRPTSRRRPQPTKSDSHGLNWELLEN